MSCDQCEKPVVPMASTCLTDCVARIAHTLPGALCCCLLRDGGRIAISCVSANFYDLTGLTKEDMAADETALNGVIVPCDLPRVMAIIAHATEKTGNFQIEFRINHRKYGERWLEWCGAPGASRQGGVVWTGFLHDISRRKQIERQLHHTQADSERAQIMAKTGCWRLDVRQNVLHWSNEVYRIFGLMPGTPLTYEIFLACVHPDDRQGVGDAWQAALHGAPYCIEHRIAVAGGMRWVREQAEMEFDRDGQLLSAFGTVQDITERKQTQQALHESEAHLRTLFENAPVPFWEEDFSALRRRLDELQPQHDGNLRGWLADHPQEVIHLASLVRVVDVNEQSVAFFGVGSKKEVWRHLPDYFDDRSLNAFADEIATLASGATHFECEIPIHTMSGNDKTVMLSLIVAPGAEQSWHRVFVCFIDISERLRLEESLRAREAQYRAVIETTSDGFWMVDGQGRLREVNDAYIRRSGYSRDELLAMSISDLEAQERPEETAAHLEKLLRDGSDFFESQHRSKSGEVWPVEISTAYWPLRGGILFVFSRDITARKEAEAEVLRLNATLEQRVEERTAELRLAASVFSNTIEGVIVTDANSIIQSVNPAFCEITGYSADEVVGQTPRLLRSEHQPPEFYHQLWQSLLASGRWQGEMWNRRKSGEVYLQWTTISMVPDSDGSPLHYVAVLHDITEMRRKDEHIRHLAYHDALTGLPNRMLFDDRLGHAITLAQRNSHRLALMFLDLDHFKAINDTLGHPVGDDLLQIAARRIAATLRQSDTVARIGGDEFLLLLDHIDDPAECGLVAGRILAALGKPIQVGGQTIQIGGSIGIALYPEDGQDVVSLMRYADTAMYAAKASGRGHFHFYQSAMTHQVARRMNLEMALRQALANGEFVLYYQPKVSLLDGSLVGMEALIRWNHPQQGLIMPGEFIPLAEESGLIGDIGDWVLQEALRQAGEWRARGLNTPKIAINVSARQMRGGAIAERICALIQAPGLRADMLELELTESAVMSDPEEATRQFEQLEILGITVAIDDFGTGYSSLSYLRRLPIHVLKIDRSFVMRADENDEDMQIIRTILALAAALQLTVVAEGVESEAQAKLLREAGCPQAQGYLFSRPLPANDLETQWLVRTA